MKNPNCRHFNIRPLFPRLIIVSAILFIAGQLSAAAPPVTAINAMVGENDAVLVTNDTGNQIFSHNIHQKLIPASTLKVLTASAALHYLGPDYRFQTEFYQTEKNDLLIKGYGDPMLISEEVSGIAKALSPKIDQVQDLILDNTYFKIPIGIPGVSANTLQPYNAPNGALCVNFNTVNFQSRNGQIKSAEPQTPMLPAALSRIKKKNLASGRILLSDESGEALLYAGQLFRYFLTREGIEIQGDIRKGVLDPHRAELIYSHVSEYPLTAVIKNLLEYSNNFMANQVLLAAGAEIHGPPATLEKGVTLLTTYCQNHLGITDIELVEGSGISRRNRVSAVMFDKILDEFKGYDDLMPHTGGIYYKTGTLDGIQTRVGYIKSKKSLYRFVILLNTKGMRTEPIIREVKKLIR